MRPHVLTAEQWVGASVDETFAFFADAGNLESITPPFLAFVLLTPRPIAMGEGTLIDYQLSLYGLPVRWSTRIDVWRPGREFVDRQLSGPYASWVHRHRFEPRDGGTLVHDHVEYELMLAPLSEPAHLLFVRRTLRSIFAYRHNAIARALGG